MAGVFMELIKKQIHMNQWKGNVATQSPWMMIYLC